MTGFLLRICAADRCLLALTHEYHHQHQHLNQVNNRALLARAAAADARQRRRRANRAQSTPLQRRRKLHGSHSLHKLVQRRLDMASHQEIRRRSSAADRAPLDPSVARAATTTSSASGPDLGDIQNRDPASKENSDSEAMPPPPPPPATDGFSSARISRHSRSASAIPRTANRLSLTLPIAPPTSDPSRPSRAATIPSVPSTPADSACPSPSDASEFIIAIAAQERKVLELKEELARAEAELTSLKKRWAAHGHEKGPGRRVDTPGSFGPSPAENGMTPRRSVDLDRRKILLQNQGTPTQARRKVLRGGHTRTLSLLSPGKSTIPLAGLGIETPDPETIGLPLPRMEPRTPELDIVSLSKRASWQPRTYQSPIAVPQIVEDFRLGLKAFVDDIRQITVGDESAADQSPRPTATGRRSTGVASGKGSPADQDTIRPSHSARPKADGIFDSPGAGTSASASSKAKDASRDMRVKAARAKHFSWTPLSFDSIDDNDWSNWDSPSSAKSTRWSGSTINSSGAEDIQSISEAGEESATPSKSRSPKPEASIMPSKLDEILPSVVNRLKPSNIKRTANSLMEEWEKSLVTPEKEKENAP